MDEEFVGFPSIRRLSRDVVVSEKIDGTSGLVFVSDAGVVRAGSRNRWVTPESDNYGFASWVAANEEELRRLGPGRHYGEWYGSGIQRRYGLTEKRFTLFRTDKWSDDSVRPRCCEVVPVLYTGPFDTNKIEEVLKDLRVNGSVAVPGWMNPEGIVVFHTHSGTLFKKTLDGDGHKGAGQRA